MELEAKINEDFSGKHLDKAKSPLLYWACFAVQMMHWPLLLFDKLEVPALKEVLLAERKLLLFARWLHRDLASSTAISYVGAVLKMHQRWLGVPLASLSVTFSRLPMLFRILKTEKPGATRVKRPWEFSHFTRWANAYEGAGRDPRRGYFGPGIEGFQLATVDLTAKLAFEHLLRLNEAVKTTGTTAADKAPWLVSDVVFQDRWGEELGWDEQGRPEGVPVLMQLRMPPSKADPLGVLNEVLQSPFPSGWENGLHFTAAGPAMWRYMRRYPVPRKVATRVSLLRQKLPANSARLTAMVFTRVFKAMCVKATIRWQKMGAVPAYGIHCFRVGGVNRLMELGASAPQICAMGRWASDCWLLYARRERRYLLEWTERMSTG